MRIVPGFEDGGAGFGAGRDVGLLGAIRRAGASSGDRAVIDVVVDALMEIVPEPIARSVAKLAPTALTPRRIRSVMAEYRRQRGNIRNVGG